MSTCRLAKILIAVSVLLTGAVQAAPSSAFAKAAPDFRASLQQSAPQAHAAAAHAAYLQRSGGAVPVSASGDVAANPSRAYPPSCLGNLVQFGLWQNDPRALQAQIYLYGDPLSGSTAEQQLSELDTVTVFRVPCGGTKSALLIEIDRPADHDVTLYPIFPGVTAQSIAPCPAPGCPVFVPRLAADPNTFFSDTFAYAPLYESNVYAFENAYGGSGDYNEAFDVFIDNLNTNDPNRYSVFHVPAFDAAQYPSAAQSLPITGYLAGNWFDANHSGEGIQTEVGEVEGTATRFITIAWYTFDASGTPYWLFGSATFTAGARSVAITQMAYESGGSFAGTGASATPALWGSITVDFPDCSTMHFSFQSAAGLPAVVPTGSGTRTWTRLTQMNGLSCQ